MQSGPCKILLVTRTNSSYRSSTGTILVENSDTRTPAWSTKLWLICSDVIIIVSSPESCHPERRSVVLWSIGCPHLPKHPSPPESTQSTNKPSHFLRLPNQQVKFNTLKPYAYMPDASFKKIHKIYFCNLIHIIVIIWHVPQLFSASPTYWEFSWQKPYQSSSPSQPLPGIYKERQLPSHKLFKIACKVYFSNSKLSGFAFCLLRFWCRYSSCLMVVIFVLSDRGLGELGDNFLETKRLYL